ncbi:hypothetical protein Tco_0554068 [Tanacetum coccineum]
MLSKCLSFLKQHKFHQLHHQHLYYQLQNFHLLKFPTLKQKNLLSKDLLELEKAVKELKQVDHSTSILASIKSQVPSIVKNYLGSSLPDAFKKFLLHVVKEALKKTLSSLGQSSSQGQFAIQATESLSEYELKKILYEKMHKSQSHMTNDTHHELYDALTWSMLLAEATTKGGDNHDKVLKKRDRGDDQYEDPSAVLNQGKKTKKTRFNNSRSSKKTSTTKESSKDSNKVEQTFDDKVGDASQPPPTNADETQTNAAPRISKKDWFKKAPRLKILDPEI